MFCKQIGLRILVEDVVVPLIQQAGGSAVKGPL